MAQASSSWQQLLKKINYLSQKTLNLRANKRLKIKHVQEPGGWLLGLAIVVAMLFWNWKLVLSTGAGVAVMLLVYLMHYWDWQEYWTGIRRFLTSSNRQLTLAVGSGGIAAFSTYMAISICVDSDSPWIAGGAILQGFGTLATLILLAWQIVNRQIRRDEAKLNGILSNLIDVDPLKRLIAVRQLTRQINDAQLEPDKQRQIADYLCVMLSREQEPVVRDAVLEGLQALNNSQLSRPVEPLQIPLTKKRATVKIYRRSS